MRNLLHAAAAALLLTLTVAVGLGAWLGWRWFTDTHLVSTDEDGRARAQVVEATLYARNELRVGRLSGTVQGVAATSRLWGWLTSTQVVKAPFTADYFVDLRKLGPSDILMSRDGRHLLVDAPDVYADQPNVDLARTSLNDVSGVFVTRGAYAEMAGRVAVSSQRVAADRAGSPENVARAREYARAALRDLFEGALRAARVDADVQVHFPADPRPQDRRRWDVSRSIEEVLGDPSLRP